LRSNIFEFDRRADTFESCPGQSSLFIAVVNCYS
jgi:hypothetical protein